MAEVSSHGWEWEGLGAGSQGRSTQTLSRARLPCQTKPPADTASAMSRAVPGAASAAHPKAGLCSHQDQFRLLLHRGQRLRRAVLLGTGQTGARAGPDGLCVIL